VGWISTRSAGVNEAGSVPLVWSLDVFGERSGAVIAGAVARRPQRVASPMSAEFAPSALPRRSWDKTQGDATPPRRRDWGGHRLASSREDPGSRRSAEEAHRPHGGSPAASPRAQGGVLRTGLVSQADSAGRCAGRRMGSKGIGMKREIAARLGFKGRVLAVLASATS